MIVEALINQIRQRFSHEKRARVCLWFDEKLEFERLIPSLQLALAEMKPAPFLLLEYKPEKYQGQLWLKHQVCKDLANTPLDLRETRRYLFYLPLSEDRLESPDDQDRHHLELLEEYRYSGSIWRINGKRPTLFAFLRQAGVPLPDEPAEQRKIFEGGRESLLAKYVSKFMDRPAPFWQTTLTADMIKSRLIGDIDQTILDLAVAPETTCQILQEKSLAREFVEAVRERYGFESNLAEPDAWVNRLVEVLALTETYLGYCEPSDFPFADRLPPITLREHHVQLLQRWLRDAESRPVWDQRIRDIESYLDLTGWAAGRDGLSFGFPHLVAQRWQETYCGFEKASAKGSELASFFEMKRALIQKEAEFCKASQLPVGHWAVLASLDRFVAACSEAEGMVDPEETVSGLAKLFVRQAPVVDRQHLKIHFLAMEQDLPSICRVADRSYAAYTNKLNQKFFVLFTAGDAPVIPDIPYVTDHLKQRVWQMPGKRAVVIVDGLRYDNALEIKDALSGLNVSVEPLQTALPTITPIGMTAILPLDPAEITLEIKNNYPHPKAKGKDTSIRENRLAILADFGADCQPIEDVENAADCPLGLGNLLVVSGHEEVDSIGHGSSANLIRHVDREIERLVRLVRKLHQWGYPEVHIITDHGYILLNEDKLPPEVKCDKEWCLVLKERFALLPAGAAVPLATLPFPWDDQVRVAVPPGLAFFKAEKSFSHGGATLQELIIPHLISRSQAKERRVGVEVVLPAFELMRAAVQVTLRPKSLSSKESGQLSLLMESPRTLQLGVFRADAAGGRSSVLPGGLPKQVTLNAGSDEANVTLFFHSSLSFMKGEILELDIRDMETTEQFPPGGIKLTVGRDL